VVSFTLAMWRSRSMTIVWERNEYTAEMALGKSFARFSFHLSKLCMSLLNWSSMSFWLLCLRSLSAAGSGYPGAGRKIGGGGKVFLLESTTGSSM